MGNLVLLRKCIVFDTHNKRYFSSLERIYVKMHFSGELIQNERKDKVEETIIINSKCKKTIYNKLFYLPLVFLKLR